MGLGTVRLLSGLAVLVLLAGGCAQRASELTLRPARPPDTATVDLAIRNVRLLDVSGNRLLRNQEILITDGQIVRVQAQP